MAILIYSYRTYIYYLNIYYRYTYFHLPKLIQWRNRTWFYKKYLHTWNCGIKNPQSYSQNNCSSACCYLFGWLWSQTQAQLAFIARPSDWPIWNLGNAELSHHPLQLAVGIPQLPATWWGGFWFMELRACHDRPQLPPTQRLGKWPFQQKRAQTIMLENESKKKTKTN